MRYTASVFKGVIVAKGINYTDFIDKNEIELTEYQYNTIPIPCKLIDGEFVPCDFPEIKIEETPTEETPKTDAEKIEELQQKIDDLQYELSALRGNA